MTTRATRQEFEMSIRHGIKRTRLAGIGRRAGDFIIAAATYTCLVYIGACVMDGVLGTLLDEPDARAVIEHWSDKLVDPSCPIGSGLKQLVGGE